MYKVHNRTSLIKIQSFLSSSVAVKWLYAGGIAEYRFSSNQAQVTTQEIINGATVINIVTNLEKLDQEINFWSLQFDLGRKVIKECTTLYVQYEPCHKENPSLAVKSKLFTCQIAIPLRKLVHAINKYFWALKIKIFS